jgi:hypothetical protein
MCFNKDRAYNIFRNNFYKEEKKQKDEINNIDVDFANRNMIPSGSYVNAYIASYEKHLLDKTDFLVKAFLESFAFNCVIKKKTQAELINELNKYFDRDSELKMTSLKSVIVRARSDKAGNSSIFLSSLYSKYSEIKNIKVELLKNLVELHNQVANKERKKNSFWNTKTRIVADISAFILLLITIFNGFGILPSLNKKSANLPVIIKYEIQPTDIKLGEPIKIIWEVKNADSVLLNNAIGIVSLSDSKIIYPKKSMNYILSAYLDNNILCVSKKVFIKDSLNNAL